MHGPGNSGSGGGATVHFIGAGPGAADLLTLRARDLIAASPVCLYAGTFVPAEMLDLCPPGARVGRHRAPDARRDRRRDGRRRTGRASTSPGCIRRPVRVLARSPSRCAGWTRWACRTTCAPGVPAFAAAAAALRRELTRADGGADRHPDAHRRAGDRDAATARTWRSSGRSGGTLVLHLAVHRIDEVVAELERRLRAGLPGRRRRAGELPGRGRPPRDGSDVAAAVREAGIRRPAVVIVGPALAAERFPDSHLYSRPPMPD